MCYLPRPVCLVLAILAAPPQVTAEESWARFSESAVADLRRADHGTSRRGTPFDTYDVSIGATTLVDPSTIVPLTDPPELTLDFPDATFAPTVANPTYPDPGHNYVVQSLYLPKADGEVEVVVAVGAVGPGDQPEPVVGPGGDHLSAFVFSVGNTLAGGNAIDIEPAFEITDSFARIIGFSSSETIGLIDESPPGALAGYVGVFNPGGDASQLDIGVIELHWVLSPIAVQGPCSSFTGCSFDDMEHADPLGNDWFVFPGTVGGGAIGANSEDLPPIQGGAHSLEVGFGSGGVAGFAGGFGRSASTDLTAAETFEFWILPDPGQEYTLQINLQEDDDNDLVADDEFRRACRVGPEGPCVVSGAGWQKVSLPLEQFRDFNDGIFPGGNGVLDARPGSRGGNGTLVSVAFVIDLVAGSAATFRTDSWRFASDPARDRAAPLGDDLQLNTYTTSDQVGVAIAGDGDGGFWTAWHSETSTGTDSSGASVQVRRFDALGEAVGTEFQINDFTSGDQAAPDVAAAAGGSAIVVWESDGSAFADTSGESIQARRVGADGAVLGAEFQVNVTTAGSQTRPAVALREDDSFLVVWESASSSGSDSSGSSVLARLFEADGDSIGGEFQVNSFTTGQQSQPAVAALAGGGFVVAWQSDTSAQSGLVDSIQGQLLDSSGGPVGAQFSLASSLVGAQTEPAVSADQQGDFLVVWSSEVSAGSDSDGRSVQARKFGADGTPVGLQLQVNSFTEGDQTSPRVALGPEGQTLVSWTSAGSSGTDSSDASVQGQELSAAGVPLGVEFQVNSFTPDRQMTPAALLTPDGDFAIAFQSESSSGGDSSGESVQIRGFSRQSCVAENLLFNGGAEAEPGGDGTQIIEAPGWVVIEGSPTVTAYGSSGFPDVDAPGPEERGANFFSGGPAAAGSAVQQVVDLTGLAMAVDTGRAPFSLCGHLGGLGAEADNALLTVDFLDGSGEVLASHDLGPVSPAGRRSRSGLFRRQITGWTPPFSRSARVTLHLRWVEGPSNEAFADSLHLQFPLVSADGFESGDTSGWSSAVP